jgi:hypothetical protein
MKEHSYVKGPGLRGKTRLIFADTLAPQEGVILCLGGCLYFPLHHIHEYVSIVNEINCYQHMNHTYCIAGNRKFGFIHLSLKKWCALLTLLYCMKG